MMYSWFGITEKMNLNDLLINLIVVLEKVSLLDVQVI